MKNSFILKSNYKFYNNNFNYYYEKIIIKLNNLLSFNFKILNFIQKNKIIIL